MAQRPNFDPYGGRTPLVDAQIGDAYPTVKRVEQHLPYIKFLSENFQSLRPRDVEFQTNADNTYVQWRYVGDVEWNDLIDYVDIAGPNVELREEGDFLQWRVKDTGEWQNLVPLKDISGRDVVMRQSGNILEWQSAGEQSWNFLWDMTDLVAAAASSEEAAQHAIDAANYASNAADYADQAMSAANTKYVVRTYAQLTGLTGQLPNEGGSVLDDNGSHVDPVSGNTVPNAGQYRWTGTAWEFLRTDLLNKKADLTYVNAGLTSVIQPFEGMNSQSGLSNNVRAYAVNETGQVILGIDTRNGNLIFQASPQNPSILRAVNDATSKIFPAGTSYGESDTVYAIAVNAQGQVVLGVDLLTGKLIANVDGGSGGGGGAGSVVELMPYIQDGSLFAVGGSGGQYTLNTDPAKQWVNAQGGENIQAVYVDADNIAHGVVVGPQSKNMYPSTHVRIVTNEGQSNAEGQAGTSRSVVYGEQLGFDGRVRMPATEAHNMWLGKVTAGGNSVELLPAEITGLEPALSKLTTANGSSSITYGTLSIEGFARRYMGRAASECNGWTPNLLVWTNAEGGQNIANMMDGAPSNRYYSRNVRAAMQRVKALVSAEGRTVSHDWILMEQGEANTSTANLGALHEAYRVQMTAAAKEILGQTNEIRMLTSQMSSFYDVLDGPLDILRYHLEHAVKDGPYWCLGPTYIYPFSSDILHYTSLGHAMRGEFSDAAIELIEREGRFDPLHAVNATRTGDNEISVTLSEEAVVDDTWLVNPRLNHGVSLVGGEIQGITVLGTLVLIQTVGPAADVTAVGFAALGHATGSRQTSTIPRSTIRSVKSIGQWSPVCGGRQMYKPFAHQIINIT